MSQSLPILLIPGLACTSRLYEAQLPALWQIGPVTVTNHTGAGSMAAVAQSILAHARPRFHMVGLSMGGYVAFEILRQAPARVARLALLDTGSRADAPEQTERRKKLIAIAEKDRLTLVNELLWPLLFHESRMPDAELRAIADAMLLETGAENFVLQQQALMSRPDSRSGLGSISSKTLVVVGDGDRLTPPELSHEIAAGIPGAKLETVAACGHLSTLERPEAVTKLLAGWLSA